MIFPMNSNNDKLQAFKSDFLRRIKEIKTTRWWRFGIVAAIFTAWVAWLGNWWVILFLFLLFDIYITGYIPLSWWKKSKNKAVVLIMGWVDAILYALILVYFVFTFVGQNYQIPSASLEKTLLTGDYLWVNKMAYGPRVPMTPIHFPLVQNTFPIINTKSYIEWPQWEYHRLKGFGDVQSGDIVVFNFPAGDTIAVKQQNPDYYTLKRMIGDQFLAENPDYAQAIANASMEEAIALRDFLGKSAIESNPEIFGEIIYRPVDRRENYVKRAVGLPGDTFAIIDGHIHIDGKPQAWPKDAQFNYTFTTKTPLSESDWDALGVAIEDRHQYQNAFSEISYSCPMTNDMFEQLKKNPNITKIEREKVPEFEYVFPANYSEQRGWNRANFGPLWIPKKGVTIQITPENWPIYERVIRNYEYHFDSYIRNGKVYIDGKPSDKYTFQMDYYFMMGDNRDNSLDSRYWGFVPEDHIVGKPMRVLISFDKDKSLFNGGIRWNRIFKNANPGF